PPSKPFTDNVAVRKVGNVFLITFQGQHRNLAIHDIDTSRLTTEELASAPDEHQAITATVTLGGTQGSAVLDETSLHSTVVDLSAITLAAGNVWTVRLSLRGVTSAHTVTVGAMDTAANLAQRLAADINARAADAYTAVADGAVLVITNRDGDTFITRLSGPASSAGAVDRTNPRTTSVDLNGTPAASEIWSVTVAGTRYTHTVLASDTLAKIAAALASAINASSFTAMAEGNKLIIVSRDGTPLTTAFGIVAAGQPALGEVWTVTLQSATSGLLSNDFHLADRSVPPPPLVFSYAVMDANQTHASVAAALAQKINVWGLPEFRATSEGGVLRIVNIAGNVFTTTFKVTRGSVDDIRTARAVEADAALVATRIDGINYYRVDVLNIDLGSRNDVFNVQGTSARTNLNLHDGDDRIYVSSTADFDLGAPVPDFLLGHLHNLNGMLNIDAGAGHHVLKISGEASTLDQPNIVISDTLRASEPSNAEIAVRGMSGGTNAFGWVDLPAGTITYRADASGDFGPEIEMWTGYGADTVTIDGTFVRPGLRTVTMLSTGLGNDVVTVNLNSVEDDFFALN